MKHCKGLLNQEAIDELLVFIKGISESHWFFPTYKGHAYKYDMVNTGDYAWFTDPYRYEKNTNGIQIPERVKQFALKHGVRPDTMLINRYVPGVGRLGLHQDRDEESKAPIISISIGCTGIFVTTKSYNGPQTKHALRNGDVFIFGGEDRMIWHGVDSILKDHKLGMRYNLTLRQVVR
jgi:alkylated DNA repair protein (DNA oxidative demethylase)